MRDFEQRIAAAAADFHGLVTRTDATRAGTGRQVRRRVANEEWITLAPGVWRLAGVPTSWEMQLHAGLAWLGPTAVVCGAAAAALHGFDGFLPGPVEFLVPRTQRWRRGPFVVHTTDRLELIDRASAGGLPVTSAARTIIDLAGRDVTSRQLAAAIDSAARSGLISIASLTARMTALRARRPAGIRRLDELMLDAGGHSYLERRFLRLLRELGMPRPRTQVVYRRDGTTVARVDFGVADRDVVIEVSGRRGHSSDADRRRDARRRNELQRQGKKVIEFTTADVLDDPDYVGRTLREHLG
jgi:hypothetical protein